MKITKAVFPVAGLGTRFLPATKASPKEMLPIVDKPLIQYAVEEAKNAGIEQIIFITSQRKRAIEDHFDDMNCIYIRQVEQLGLGHAIYCARSVINDEPFAVLLADDLITAKPGCLAQMIAAYQQNPGNIIAVQEIANKDSSKYGVIDGVLQDGDLYKVNNLVEKPAPVDAPSNLGVVGRYILEANIFTALEGAKHGAGGEIQITDAIAKLIDTVPTYAYKFAGRRFDCGDKLGYLQAVVHYGINHLEFGESLRKFIDKEIIK